MTFRIVDDSVKPIRMGSRFLHGPDEQGTPTPGVRVRGVKAEGRELG